jgi:hypothetical protein
MPIAATSQACALILPGAGNNNITTNNTNPVARPICRTRTLPVEGLAGSLCFPDSIFSFPDAVTPVAPLYPLNVTLPYFQTSSSIRISAPDSLHTTESSSRKTSFHHPFQEHRSGKPRLLLLLESISNLQTLGCRGID